MTFPDPYSHLRLAELREEQLTRKAALARSLGLDIKKQSPARQAFAGALRAVADRLAPQTEAPHAHHEHHEHRSDAPLRS
jgi:hypothetical protein